MQDFHRVLQAFGISTDNVSVTSFGTGLIHHTWKIIQPGRIFILQRINHHVFKQPEDIAYNLQIAGEHLHQHFPDYPFVLPLKTMEGKNLLVDPVQGYYRLVPFIENSHAIDVVQTTVEAYEAANAFGIFTRMLSDFDCRQLKITLPDFHNISLRYRQLQEASVEGNRARIQQAEAYIRYLQSQQAIVTTFEKLKRNHRFIVRATHHDTKISNVLFNPSNKSICVIDLDTLMPGYFISDVGDMIRTYISPVSEEETDFEKINVREEIFDAIVHGYMDAMHDILTPEEKELFIYAGKFMIYMQALRFLTDHLQNDVYYGAQYEGHNFIRSGNQITLLQRLTEKEKLLQQIVNKRIEQGFKKYS